MRNRLCWRSMPRPLRSVVTSVKLDVLPLILRASPGEHTRLRYEAQTTYVYLLELFR